MSLLDGPSEFWQLTLTVKEVFIYKIPPLATAAGHRAEDWNLATPLLTGSMKTFQSEGTMKVVLYGADGAEFGECPITVQPREDILKFVEGVIDSSRYFVLRLVDKANAKRSAMIGIGFREREDAFDFKNVLNEYVRFVDRLAMAAAAAAQDSITGALLDLDMDGPGTAAGGGVPGSGSGTGSG